MMGASVVRIVLRPSLWNHCTVFLAVFAMYAPEHRAQCGRNAAGDGKNMVLPPTCRVGQWTRK